METLRQKQLIINYSQKELNINDITTENISYISVSNNYIFVGYNFNRIEINYLDFLGWVKFL